VKKQIDPPIKPRFPWRLLALRIKIIQPPGLSLIRRIVFGAVALGLAALGSGTNLAGQSTTSPAALQPSRAEHESRIGFQELIGLRNPNEITPSVGAVLSASPTRSGFMATWPNVTDAKGYLLDVSTSSSFSSYMDGYCGLDVGRVNGRAVTGLKPGTTYYYRVRAYTAASSGEYSNVTSATTQAAAGLMIDPIFDDSIVSNPNAAAIEAMIVRAIGIYESLFSDPITIHIFFRYSDTAPNGDSLAADVLAQSFSTIYTMSWNDFISHLRADATSSNDNQAIASLPGSPLSANIAPSSANGRAVGLNTSPALFPDGTVAQGGTFDGIVTLNSAQPFSFARPLLSGSFDAQRSIEHEIDEIMGLGSHVRPTECASSYEAESVPPNAITGGAVIQSCPACSGGEDVGYVGNNSGTLTFNGVTGNAAQNHVLTIWYTNGDAVRYAILTVNGGTETPVSFPSTGSFQTVGSIQTTVILSPGSNSLNFSNPIVNDWAPDFDRIGIDCSVPPPVNLRPQDLFSWSSRGVRNLSLEGSRYFSIDSGRTNIVGFNQALPGDLGDWLSEFCPQQHPFVQNAFACPNQFSDVSATSPEGINLDVIGYDLVSGTQPHLSNLSTRAFVQAGDNLMIGGLIVQGTEPKRVILRAIGPELTQYGVPNALINPTLDLHDANGVLIASNDDWQHTIIGGIIGSDQVQDIQNSGHAPGDARESAIIADLAPGNYTAIVRGLNNSMGVALVEAYDLSPTVHSVLGNISTRSFVRTDADVMIGGFIVQGAQPKNVIIRAIGRELTQYGIPDFLADPTLELHNGNGALIASNNNWQQTIIGGIITHDQVQDIQNSGHAPTDPSESAILANLPPGNYTAIVRGVNNTTGVALVEVYDLH
jgi:hypothetical protein